jgi:hypothetical protein
VDYAGLAPGLAGYQIDVTVPTGLTAGDNVLEVDCIDSTTVETLISAAGSSNVVKRATPRGRLRKKLGNRAPQFQLAP